jgi:hypothetical protein
MMTYKQLLSAFLLLGSVCSGRASTAFSRGLTKIVPKSVFGIPRGGGLFGGNKDK